MVRRWVVVFILFFFDGDILVPALYDPNVSMALSQHLFDVQMGEYFTLNRQYIVHSEPGIAKYRSQYPYNPFQNANVRLICFFYKRLTDPS